MTQVWNLKQEEIFSEGFATTPWPQLVFYPEQLRPLAGRNFQEEYTGDQGLFSLFRESLKRGFKEECQSQAAWIIWVVQQLNKIAFRLYEVP